MLKVATKLNQLNFTELMSVYTQSNAENGRAYYPGKDAQLQMMEAEQDFYAYLRGSFFAVPSSIYAVWEEERKYISALRLEKYDDGYLLAGLETHPDHRERGFAKKLINAVISYLQQRGIKKLYAHVSRSNTASVRLHEACGFQRVLGHAVYIDGSVSTDAVTFLKILD